MVNRLCLGLKVGCKTARAVLSVLKKQKPDGQPHIDRVGRPPVIIPKNKVMAVQCGRLSKGVLHAQHVVLKLNHEALWPAGLVSREQLIQLPPEDNTVTVTSWFAAALRWAGCSVLMPYTHHRQSLWRVSHLSLQPTVSPHRYNLARQHKWSHGIHQWI